MVKEDDPTNIIALSIRADDDYPNTSLLITQEIIDAVENAKNGKLRTHSLPNTD